jgi:DNA-binding XRE family transcriptional regulator
MTRTARNPSMRTPNTTPTPHQYRKLRIRFGSQVAAAKVLGLDRGTLIRREQGRLPITPEAALAIAALAASAMLARPVKSAAK